MYSSVGGIFTRRLITPVGKFSSDELAGLTIGFPLQKSQKKKAKREFIRDTVLGQLSIQAGLLNFD